MKLASVLTAAALLAALFVSLPAPAGAEDRRLSITFEDTDVIEVITTIANFAAANVIVSPAVEGRVSVSLRDVPWRSALEAVAVQVGARVVTEEHGILRVVPFGAAASEMRAAREKAKAGAPPEPQVLDAVRELHGDVRALRGEIRELTVLLRRVLETRPK